jgi:MoxR-like ATPase
VLGTELIRLQCYEGIDQATAVYEWNYARQLLYIRVLEASRSSAGVDEADGSGRLAAGGAGRAPTTTSGGEHAQGLAPLRLPPRVGEGGGRGPATLSDVFGPEFLIRRPLLHAIDAAHERPPVLLIDELDRADAEFEAYLLELLSDYAITIPELGTLRAEQKPIVVLTSNRTRDIHDALRRRCLYYWIEYPTLEKEYAIVRARVSEAPEQLARQVVTFVQMLRGEDLFKAPGVAETLDWLAALVTLGQTELAEGPAHDALGALLKYQDDMAKVTSGNLLGKLVEKVRAAGHSGGGRS